jgi:hypothetical protein
MATHANPWHSTTLMGTTDNKSMGRCHLLCALTALCPGAGPVETVHLSVSWGGLTYSESWQCLPREQTSVADFTVAPLGYCQQSQGLLGDNYRFLDSKSRAFFLFFTIQSSACKSDSPWLPLYPYQSQVPCGFIPGPPL